jgi:hypothetical protein
MLRFCYGKMEGFRPCCAKKRKKTGIKNKLLLRVQQTKSITRRMEWGKWIKWGK